MFPWFEWKTIALGPLTIQVWGMFVALGMIVSLWHISRIAKQQKMPVALLLDIAMTMIVSGVLGARIFHVLFYAPMYYLSSPWEVIAVWHGGMSSFGGLIGAIIGAGLFVWFKKVPQSMVWSFLDIMSVSALYGWIIGRVGCLCIHDHLGVPCDCFLAVQHPTGPRLDMALLEIIGLLPLVLFFWVSKKQGKPQGWYTSILFVYYGCLRFVLDFFRARDIATADVRYLGLTPGQYVAIVLVGGGIWLMSLGVKQKK